MAIEVRRKEKEPVQSLITRFTRKVKQSGVLLEAKKRQYRDRLPNKRKRRLSAIYRAQKTKEYEKMKKLGLI
jgi:ribosomal protein S21